MRIALSVEYNGSNYFGWQKQKIHKEKTIQYHIDASNIFTFHYNYLR